MVSLIIFPAKTMLLVLLCITSVLVSAAPQSNSSTTLRATSTSKKTTSTGVLRLTTGTVKTTTTVLATGTANACAQVSPLTEAALSKSPQATPSISADIALACLQSVPNKQEPAKKLVTSLRAFLTWQSTLAWLKNPPTSYLFPPVDILGGLDNISSTAVAGNFKSEYDFQLSIIELIAKAHDGHFSYRPDIFKTFIFRNTLLNDLVSVSKDGKQIPQLFHYSGIRTDGLKNSSFSSSAITKINGEDAAAFLEKVNLKYNNYQDPDAQWNSQFQMYAGPTLLPIAAASLFYQHSKITLTYEDGTQRSQDTVAAVRKTVDFKNIKSGEDYYNKFCNPDATTTSSTSSAAAPAATSTSSSTSLAPPAPTIDNYPFPVVRDNGANVTAGYFLNGTDYSDVAVLSVIGFSPEGTFDGTEYLNNFQSTVANFLAACKQANKQKLVIDLTTNGGGFVVAGYELFKQLFPGEVLFQADNIRLASSVEDMARMANDIPNDIVKSASSEQKEALQALQESVIVSNLLPGGVFKPDGANLTNVNDILAPVTLLGDRFTAYQQTPLNETSSDFNLTGTGNKANAPPAVFKPQNIVLLTDGTAASTATLFSYLMILQKNIATVSVGGRPSLGVMQSIGGVEGAQVFPLADISDAAGAVLALSSDQRQTEVEGSDLAIIAEGYALTRATTPANPGSINGKNAFSMTDSKTPLQFLYQPANCRFFYTLDMIYGPAEVWKRAADATWKDPEAFCVEGSRVSINTSTKVEDPQFRTLVGGVSSMFDSRTLGLSVSVAVFTTLLLSLM